MNLLFLFRFYPWYILEEKNYFEQFGVILALFFNIEVNDAVKKDKGIFISNFTEEPLVCYSVSYICKT